MPDQHVHQFHKNEKNDHQLQGITGLVLHQLGEDPEITFHDLQRVFDLAKTGVDVEGFHHSVVHFVQVFVLPHNIRHIKNVKVIDDAVLHIKRLAYETKQVLAGDLQLAELFQLRSEL